MNLIIQAFLDGLPEGTETVGIVIPNSICLTSTDTIYFTITDYFMVGGSTAYSDTTIQCGNEVVLLSEVSSGMEPYFYQWSNGSDDDTALVSPVITSQYYLTITDACGYTVIDSTLVNIFGPDADAGADTSICIGGTVVLTADGGSTYHWSTGEITPSITVSPVINTSYYVTVTEVCSDIDTVTIIVNPLPVVSITSTADSICPGESALLSAHGASTYVWSSFPVDPSLNGQTTLQEPNVSPTSSTLYTLTGTDIHSCTSTSTQMIVLKPVPNANFAISEYNPCQNEPVIITYLGNAPPSSSFSWDFSGGDIITGSGIGPYEIAWENPGYSVISLQVNLNGCLSQVEKDSVYTMIKPAANFDADVTSGCSPLEVSFTNYSTSVMPSTQYEWLFGNGDRTILQHPDYTYNNSGSFSVSLIVSNQYGCSDTLTKNALIQVYPNPEALFSMHPHRVSILDPLVKFYNNSFGNIQSWTWDFGDGSTGATPDIIHSYADTGTYTVVFVVTTDHGCVDTAFGEVVVMPDNTIFIPNAFSPNNDGQNDIFLALGTNIIEFSMNIYTRWGENIFSSDNIDIGWDGKYKGDIVKTGVYEVIIRYRDINGNRRSYYGRVTVLR